MNIHSGAGKSTWAKWLQREALSARWVGICVRVELRNVLVESLPSLHQLVRKEAGQHLVGLAPVADVELFVAQCIDVNHLSLAYGILLDQYDRFQPRIREQYVKRLIAIDQTEIDYEFNRFWVFSHSIKYAGNEDILSIPAFNLRGLSSDYAASSVDFLLERVVSDRSLTWRDIDKEVGEARNVVWMACASTSRDFGEWKECITSPSLCLLPY